MKYFLFLISFLFTISASAEYSSWGKPTQVNLVLSTGFRIVGNFGSPNACDIPNQIFIGSTHPQYDQIYSMALAAVASQSKMRFEVRKCTVIGWLSGQTIAILDSSNPGQVDFAK